MEGRTHSGAAFTAAGSLSRMKQDLLACFQDLLVGLQPRVAIRARDVATKTPHIGVIGAGLAGLRCAEVLIEGGAKVTILEARDRIGGRIHQSKFGTQIVDMGPNWVHGTDDNPIHKLAQETETMLCAVSDTMRVFEPSGKVMPPHLAASGLETVWAFIDDAFKYSNDEDLCIKPNLSLKDFFHERLAESNLSEDQQARVLLLAEMWGSFIGDSWDRQSLRWFWLEECLEGENLYVMESYARVLQHVAAKPLAYADVHLSTQVTNIESTRTDVRDPRIAVETDAGVFKFDEVVVAVPLGCLKQERPAFDPPLPPRLQRAILNASYSSLEKVYITFPTAFWERPVTSASLMDDYNQEKDGPADASPGFVHFLRPEYVPKEQKHWAIEMVPLSSPDVFGSHARPTLLIYTHDPCAAHVSNLIRGLSSDSVEYFDVLDRFFQPYYSRLPNYQPGHADCTPTAVIATDWHSDDLAGNGSYTNFQVSPDTSVPVSDGQIPGTGLSGGKYEQEEIHLDDDIRIMRAGLPERGIWLAGEHTAPFVALGTTTGAYWSGEMAALRVLAANGMNVKGVTAPAAR